MEDFDAMAGSIAYKHCSPKIVSNSNMEEFEDLPFLIVTASVDRIDLLNPLRPDLDMKIYGHVTYVGSSSMEVTIRVESKGNPNKSSQIDSTSDISEAWTPILICKFTMVLT